MTHESLTLQALEEGLRQPFAFDEIKFLPKSPMNASGKWQCLALPYADKRSYEDRLNALAFGHWSTPPVAPCVAGNKLVVPVTVVLCGVAHTDYGEAFLSSHSRSGEQREEENSATEAYSQGFRRTCAQFRLGRYLYALPKLWVAYDPAKRAIALSSQELRQHAERLYRQAGLQGGSEQPSSAPSPSQETSQQANQEQQNEGANNEFINERQVAWVKQQLQYDEARIRNVCTHYRVERLDLLTQPQTINLTNRLLKEASSSKYGTHSTQKAQK